jgi:hypothetical protein
MNHNGTQKYFLMQRKISLKSHYKTYTSQNYSTTFKNDVILLELLERDPLVSLCYVVECARGLYVHSELNWETVLRTITVADHRYRMKARGFYYSIYI